MGFNSQVAKALGQGAFTEEQDDWVDASLVEMADEVEKREFATAEGGCVIDIENAGAARRNRRLARRCDGPNFLAMTLPVRPDRISDRLPFCLFGRSEPRRQLGRRPFFDEDPAVNIVHLFDDAPNALARLDSSGVKPTKPVKLVSLRWIIELARS